MFVCGAPSACACSTGLHGCAEMQRIPVSAAGHLGRVFAGQVFAGQGLHSWADGSAASQLKGLGEVLSLTHCVLFPVPGQATLATCLSAHSLRPAVLLLGKQFACETRAEGGS